MPFLTESAAERLASWAILVIATILIGGLTLEVTGIYARAKQLAVVTTGGLVTMLGGFILLLECLELLG